MPARDTYHDVVRTALVKDGWVITHDPYRLVWGPKVVDEFFVGQMGEALAASDLAHVIGFDPIAEVIMTWIP